MKFSFLKMLKDISRGKDRLLTNLNINELDTHHGTIVVEDNASGLVTHVNKVSLLTHPNRYKPINLLTWPEDSDFGFLISSGSLRKISVVGDAWDGSILSYRVVKDVASQSVALRHPQTELFLCAELPGNAQGEALSATRPEKGLWETFRLRAATPPPSAATIERLSHLLGHLDPYDLRNLLLDDDKIDADAFQAFCRLLDLEDFQVLASLLLTDASALLRLEDLYPQGKWAIESASQVYPPAQQHPERRNIIPCGLDLNWLARDSEKDDWGGLPQMLNRIVRRASKPRSTACLLTCVRNEGIYLVEWIAYHRLLGFEHIFVYSNDNTDGSDFLLEQLAKNDLITWLPNTVGQGVAPQYVAYGHALKMLPDVLDYEWMALIDVDEFIVIDESKFSSLNDFLTYHQRQDADSVSLRWRMVGQANASMRNEELITHRFTQSFQDNCPFLKSIFRPRLFSHANPHFPTRPHIADASYRLASGEKHRDHSWHESDRFSHAWIDHHYFKSIEEALVRRSQNRGHEALANTAELDRISDDILKWMFSVHDGQFPVSQSGGRQSLDGLETEVNRILSRDGVREAHNVANAGYLSLLHDLVKTMETSSRFSSGDTLARRAYSIVAESVTRTSKHQII